MDVDCPSTSSGYVWSEEDQKILRENCDYFARMMKVVERMTTAGPNGITLPKRPRRDISYLLRKRRVRNTTKLTGEELHRYLCTKLFVNPGKLECPTVDEIGKFTSLNDVTDCLKTGFELVKATNSSVLSQYLEYGKWLNIAFELFNIEKASGKITTSWSDWLQECIGISPSYARKLREVSDLFEGYLRLKHLGISFYELYLKRKDILQMFKLNKEINSFWKENN